LGTERLVASAQAPLLQEPVHLDVGEQWAAVEDPLVVWDESQPPFQGVVIIRIPTHDIDAGGRVEIAENLAFAPWHALPEHRPLGANNRARRIIYI
jgi:hypothetical protein